MDVLRVVQAGCHRYAQVVDVVDIRNLVIIYEVLSTNGAVLEHCAFVHTDLHAVVTAPPHDSVDCEFENFRVFGVLDGFVGLQVVREEKIVYLRRN